MSLSVQASPSSPSVTNSIVFCVETPIPNSTARPIFTLILPPPSDRAS